MPGSILTALRKSAKDYLNGLYLAGRADRARFEERILEYDPQAVLLDCGCYRGEKTPRLLKYTGARQVVGLEYSLDALRQAAQQGVLPIRADLNQPMPLRASAVDVIYASNVIEHLVDPQLFVQEMLRVLRPGGYLVLDTPNLASWHNIFALLIGRQPFSGPNITHMEDSDVPLVRELHRRTHGLPEQGETTFNEREYTRHLVVMAYRSLLEMVTRAGFKIVEKSGSGYFPLPPLLARLFQRLDPAHAHHVTFKAVKPPDVL